MLKHRVKVDVRASVCGQFLVKNSRFDALYSNSPMTYEFRPYFDNDNYNDIQATDIYLKLGYCRVVDSCI